MEQFYERDNDTSGSIKVGDYVEFFKEDSASLI
jgi:hypothetical protein